MLRRYRCARKLTIITRRPKLDESTVKIGLPRPVSTKDTPSETRSREDDDREKTINQQNLAQLFGLSLSTFSRFAGSRWRKRSDRAIPDLWLNTAQTLASHRALVEAAKDAGVWHRVGQVLQQAASSPKAAVDHA